MINLISESLSALQPVKFSYNFNKEEKLDTSLYLFSNGFGYYTHTVFQEFRDAVLSKKNYLILTKNISLKDMFNPDSYQISIGKLAGSFYLKAADDRYFTKLRNEIFVGGIGEKLLLTVIPISDNYVELVSEDFKKKITVDEDYPYTVRLSQDILNEDKIHRQRFEMEYQNNLISFKVKIKEGYRFLSYGKDNVVRATGLMLNDTVCNNYFHKVEMITDDGLYYGFDARSTEIKYYNQLPTFVNQNTVTIREEKDIDTHLLISCSTKAISKSTNVSINVSLTKSNFSAAGTYLNTED